MKSSLVLLSIVLTGAAAQASIKKEVISCTNAGRSLKVVNFTVSRLRGEIGTVYFAKAETRAPRLLPQASGELRVVRRPGFEGQGDLYEAREKGFSLALTHNATSVEGNGAEWNLSGEFLDQRSGIKITVNEDVDCRFH